MLASRDKWIFNEKPEGNWLGESKFSPVMQELFRQRGIHSDENATDFLEINLEKLHHPGLLSGMDKAIARVLKAIENNEQILIFGDYDADGVTSTALLMKAIKELAGNCEFYIPNRFLEGYGPNKEAFQFAKDRGFSLIITVDTGIAAFEEIAYAKELGLDVIITDHHDLQDKIPDAYAVINPKCSPDYPFADLAGVGVAFKFAHALLGYLPEYLLELVAIGTVADLMPLIDENRMMVATGLKRLESTNHAGIKALLNSCYIEGAITEEVIGFQIGPRINAVGRLQDAELAVELLMAEDTEEAALLAEEVHDLNEERKKIVQQIVKEAEKMVLATELPNIIIVAKEDWHEGVLGIVASRLVNKFQRPAIVLSINAEKNEAKGSARSISAFNLFKTCMEIKPLFKQFGGHALAAGMTIELDNLAEITTYLNEVIGKQLSADDFKSILEISQELVLEDINLKLVEDINLLAPFGMGNPKPLFKVKHKPVDVRKIGANQNHLKLSFQESTSSMDVIGFSKGEIYPYITAQEPIEVVGELSINEWNGNRKVQMMLKDLSIRSWQLFDYRGKKNVALDDFLMERSSQLIVKSKTRDVEALNQTGFTILNYGEEINSLPHYHHVYFLDLPPSLTMVKEIIQQTQPNNIHTCYYEENSLYLQPFPSRDAFVTYYSLVRKHQPLDLRKELKKITQTYGWSKENIVFMTEVFLDLEFLTADNGVLQAVLNPLKKDLEESDVFKKRKEKIEIEKVLYYYPYDKLKEWFEQFLDKRSNDDGEEMNNGLQTIY